MIPDQKVKVKWNSANKKHYVSKGYLYTKMGDELLVDINHLTKGSHSYIKVICDYCNKEHPKIYKDYIKISKKTIVKKDCCEDCLILKHKDTIIKKFNVDNISKIEEVKEKKVSLSLEKFGCKSPMQNQLIKAKQKETIQRIYNVENVSQNKEIQNKKKKTLLLNWGVDHPSKSKELMEKAIIAQRKTMFKNSTVPTSRQQKHIHKLVGGELNYPIRNVSLDIAFPNEKIYIEYDGGGHDLSVKLGQIKEDIFVEKERKRRYMLMNRGWREIRIISRKDRLPSDQIILNTIKKAFIYFESGHSWYEIDIDESKIKCSQYKKEIDLGELRCLVVNKT